MSRRVLHVVDRVTGGVPVAVRTYIENTPRGVGHSILSPFDDGAPAAVWGEVGVEHLDLGAGHVTRRGRVASAVAALRPDVVHAHSSFAGAYARTAVRRSRARIVYSPHCFSFERRDLPRAARVAFRAIEAVLGWNTDVLAACGAGERRLADRVRSLRGKSLEVPNIASVASARAHPWSGGVLRVGMAGRLSVQKDPAYFARALDEIARSGIEARGVWVGAADPSFTRGVPAHIETTGWLAPDALAQKLSQLHLYVHSAAWEGFPIAVLDAHAAGLPILVRPIAALPELPEELTVEGALRELRAALRVPALYAQWARRNRAGWASYLGSHTRDAQRRALETLWRGDTVSLDPEAARR